MSACYNRANGIKRYSRTGGTVGSVTEAPGGATMAKIITCGIYKITNLIDGKCYIGQSRYLAHRWAQHKHGRRKDHNRYLYNAIHKYGIDNFSFEALEECDTGKLDDLERKYIVQFNSLKPNGYNLEKGGNTNKEITVETKRRMSLAWANRPPITNTERLNRALSHFKAVSQYTLKGGYIRTFQSIKEAAKSVCFPESNIINCCKKKNNQKTVGGYQWRYASNEYGNIDPVIYCYGDGHCTSVSQYTQDGKYLNTYESVKKASLAIKVSNGCISSCLTGNQKTSRGFIWRYAE
jgi:hypothetical protein